MKHIFLIFFICSLSQAKSQESRIERILELCGKNAKTLLHQKVERDFKDQASGDDLRSSLKEVKIESYNSQIASVNQILRKEISKLKPDDNSALIKVIFNEYRSRLSDLPDQFYQETEKDIFALN